MKWNQTLKRVCAFALAIGTVLPSIPGKELVKAADAYGLRFVSSIYPGVTTDNTQMINYEGESLTVNATIPTSLSLPVNNEAFRITEGATEINNHFTIDGATNNGRGSYVLTPIPDQIGLSDAQSSRSYVLEAKYLANGVLEGEGSAVAHADAIPPNPNIPDDEGTPVFNQTDGFLKVQCVDTQGFSLTDDTHIVIEFDNLKLNNNGTVTASSGYLLTLFPPVDGTVTDASTASITDNGDGTFGVAVSNKQGTTKRFIAKFNLNGKSISELDTLTLTFYFTKPQYNNLMLTMVTPKKAMEADKQKLSATYENATMEDDVTPYFKLSAGDSMDKIRGSSISVKTTVPRYNSKQIGIKWGWIADNSEADNIVQWHDQVMTVTEPDEDQTGFLAARFYYQPKNGGAKIWLSGTREDEDVWDVKMPIRVLGRGDRPTLNFLRADYMKRGANGVWSQDQQTYPEAEQSQRNFKMDLYDGKPIAGSSYNPLNKDTEYGLSPFHLTGNINFGTSRNAATSFTIKQEIVGSKGGVKLKYDGSDYNWGDQLDLERESLSDILLKTFDIYADEEGNVKLVFDFYGDDGNVMPENQQTVYITVSDSRPSEVTSLETLDMLSIFLAGGDAQSIDTFKKMYPTTVGGYHLFTGFEFEPNQQPDPLQPIPIALPNIVDKIRLHPSYTDHNNTNHITVEAEGVIYEVNPKSSELFTTTQGDGSKKLGQITEEIPLREGVTIMITVHCTSQAGTTDEYVLRVTRAAKNAVAVLKDLSVRPEKTSPREDDYELSPSNDPFETDDRNYTVHIPYRQKSVYVEAFAKNEWATKIDITKDDDSPKSLFARVAQQFTRSAGKEIEVDYIEEEDGTIRNATDVTILVMAEDGRTEETYKLRIIKDPPSTNTNIAAPEVSYWLKSDNRTEIPIELDGPFYVDEPEIFTKLVEYSTNRVRLKITPEDYRAAKITVEMRGGKEPQVWELPTTGNEVTSHDFNFPNVVFDEENRAYFTITVEAEKPGVFTTPPYTVIVERKPPSRNTNADVKLTNMITNAEIDFAYRNSLDDYPEVSIDYSPGDMRVLIEVTPEDPKTTVLVNGKTPRPDGTEVRLSPGSTTTVTIELTAEDGVTKRVITIPLKYNAASKNCYLSALNPGGLKYLPDPTIFVKEKTSYKIEIPKGTTTLPVTPTLLKDGSDKDSSNATITINGAPVKDGEAYNFQPTEKNGKITVVVTAQDGKSKRTYTINYKNWNLIVPSDTNLLQDLKIDYGDLQPKFSPNTQEYDFSVKPDAKVLKIFPKLKDKNGELRVVAGKVLTEFDGAYTTSIMDDEMDIHIYVWSEKDVVNAMGTANTGNTDTPTGEAAGTGTSNDLTLDKALARDYVIHVYRDDEDHIGSLKPITADMVDFNSTDPIVIDITQYPIISAEVFNTLKTDYADKSILFKGNDYTLQCFGSDIEGTVPNTESFDLRFSFYTPDQDKIEDLIDDIGSNGHIDPVYYYFNQHGALPAEMLLTVSLGRHYRNQTLYWNYFNEERERIDYYGYVRTNATGTFSVPLSHFSTYMTTEDKIRGAENKSTEYGNAALSPDTENLNAPSSVNKAIPNTGAGVNG